MIEAVTFRMGGHAQHDDASYVPAELVAEWGRKDPIERYERWLLSEGIVTDRDIRTIDAGIEAQLDEDVKWAEQCPPPEPESALTGVYADDSPFHPPAYSWK